MVQRIQDHTGNTDRAGAHDCEIAGTKRRLCGVPAIVSSALIFGGAEQCGAFEFVEALESLPQTIIHLRDCRFPHRIFHAARVRVSSSMRGQRRSPKAR